jgi:hypothetical protein
MSMKNSNDTIWNRTSDLPICSKVQEMKSVFKTPVEIFPYTTAVDLNLKQKCIFHAA